MWNGLWQGAGVRILHSRAAAAGVTGLILVHLMADVALGVREVPAVKYSGPDLVVEVPAVDRLEPDQGVAEDPIDPRAAATGAVGKKDVVHYLF